MNRNLNYPVCKIIMLWIVVGNKKNSFRYIAIYSVLVRKCLHKIITKDIHNNFLSP